MDNCLESGRARFSESLVVFWDHLKIWQEELLIMRSYFNMQLYVDITHSYLRHFFFLTYS